jgi:dihydroorotase
MLPVCFNDHLQNTAALLRNRFPPAAPFDKSVYIAPNFSPGSMTILLKKALIVNEGSPFHQQQKDVLITQGVITAVQDDLSAQANYTVLETEGLTITPGWTDIFADFSDPGYEFRETIDSGCAAAAAGGYTQVALVPNTSPAVTNKTQVEYLLARASGKAVQVLPIGAVTQKLEGNALAEMYDMEASGAVAFSDGWNSLQSAGVLLKALQYVKAIDKTVIQLPVDKTINAHGLVHEGIVSTQLGLPGIPAIGEELLIARDIELLQYTGSKLHLTGISTQKGLELVQAARQKGLAISCSVTPHHLLYCDEDLAGYNTHLKVSPPLRSRSDRDYLRQAVRNGEVDCIASHHRAQDWDSKACEFEYARHGIAGIQTAFHAVLQAIPDLQATQVEQLFSANTARILGLENKIIREGESANITVFSMLQNTVVEKAAFKSRSANNALIGATLPGKVLGIINKGQLIIN